MVPERSSPQNPGQTPINWKKVIEDMDTDLPQITKGEFLDGLVRTNPGDMFVQQAYDVYRQRMAQNAGAERDPESVA